MEVCFRQRILVCCCWFDVVSSGSGVRYRRWVNYRHGQKVQALPEMIQALRFVSGLGFILFEDGFEVQSCGGFLGGLPLPFIRLHIVVQRQHLRGVRIDPHLVIFHRRLCRDEVELCEFVPIDE